jgi:carboxyl-terminal processing protease
MIAKYYQKLKADSSLFAKLNNYTDLAAFMAKDKDVLNAEIAKFAANEDATANKAIENSDKYIRYQLKALLARNLYDMNAYYQVVKDIDDTYLKAVEIIKNDKMFDKLKGK